MKTNPIGLAAVPLLLAVAFLGCQTAEKEQGRTEKAGTAGQTAGKQTAPFGASGVPAPDSTFLRIPEQKFDADPALLGFTYEDSALGIRFSPPRSWPPIEPGLMEQAKRAYESFAAAQQDDQFVSKPVRVFYEKDKRYFMIVSNFTNWPVPVDPISKMEEYRQRVAARNPGSILHYGMSRHGKVVLFQMLMVNQIIANMRVIVIREGRVPVQIDYLVPQQVYPDVAKGIDASIGSIQPI